MRSPSRLHALIAALPLAVWTLFHLWEQWAAFAGRDAWAVRVRATSQGALGIAIELAVIVVPLAVWAGFTFRAAIRREALPGTARPEDRGLVRVVGRLAPIAAFVAIAFLVLHVGHLWGPKLVRGASELEAWSALTHDVGRPWMLVLYAIGLTAVALHLAAAIPAALGALGWVVTDSARRSAVLVSSVLALCVWILAVQLTGWLATGAGTFWPIEVIETPAELDVAP
ncbi:MAG: hypothetical protein M3Y87_25970 [Myxococcota bacterium]|nr:hypothetical protein [Myxococcota bacterium]